MTYKQWLENGGIKLPVYIESWLLLIMKTKDRSELLNSDLESLFALDKAGKSTFLAFKSFIDNNIETVSAELNVFIKDLVPKYGQILERVIGKV